MSPPSAPRVLPGDYCCRAYPPVRRLKEVDNIVFQVCNAHSHEGLWRETTQWQYVKLTGTLITCNGYVQAKGMRASTSTTTLSQNALPLQRGFVGLASPRQISSAVRALYLILFIDDCDAHGIAVPPQEQKRCRRGRGDPERLD